MDKDENDEAYATHLSDQIDAARDEQERVFLERAQKYGVEEPISVSEDLFEQSYIGRLVEWLTDEEKRANVFGCKHLEFPQPVWIFIDTPNLLQCDTCAEVLQVYKTANYDKEESRCDICDEKGEISWVFGSYSYFTLAGLVCKTCSDKHEVSLGQTPSD